EILADEDLWLRMNAAIALFQLRADAAPAIPALTKALKDTKNEAYVGTFTLSIQAMIALALGRASSGNSEAVAALTETMESAGTRGLRRAAAQALGEVGPEALAAV